MRLPITFLNPDSDIAREALERAMQSIPERDQSVGLVLKVAITPEGDEKLVNYQFADPGLIRSLALVLPDECESITPKE
jgi:hypothetical protein